eukprot:SAG22_NODE_16631_length_321_cov_0.693694_1_plen_61_part_10
MTRAALEMLVCRTPCPNGCAPEVGGEEDCGCRVVTVGDAATVCWEGAHLPAAAFAVASLVE